MNNKEKAKQLGLNFSKEPDYPIKATGEISILNWEIPVKYAIDSNGVCWMDDGHGGSLLKVSKKDLQRTIRNQLDKAQSQHTTISRHIEKYCNE